MLPYSPAADRNKDVILEKLTEVFANSRRILEIGSGNGQHAVHVTNALPHLVWQCSDLEENVAGIAARLEEEGNDRTPAPLVIDVDNAPLPVPAAESGDAFDGLFTANTLHIMSFAHVEAFFTRTGELLAQGGRLCVYGPLKYGGKFTTESNKAFDAQLKSWDPVSGIRDFETLDELASKAGLSFETDQAMPANNQLVVWRRG